MSYTVNDVYSGKTVKPLKSAIAVVSAKAVVACIHKIDKLSEEFGEPNELKRGFREPCGAMKLLS